MNKLIKTLGICGMIITLSACVTTREQLNAEKGISADRSTGTSENKTITSENIALATPAPVFGPVPLVVPGPMAQQQGPMVLPGPVAAASPAPVKKSNVGGYTEDELRSEVTRLTGLVEELQHEKEISEQAKVEETKRTDAKIADLEKQVKDLQPDVAKIPEGMTPIDAGKDSLQAGRYDEAIVYFTQSISQKDTGKDAEEATYLRGEAYFKKQQYNKAIVDFSHFPEKFQKSSFHPKALLRIAESFEAMGRKDDAKAFYSDLMDKFPRTAEGKVAKKRLKVKL